MLGHPERPASAPVAVAVVVTLALSLVALFWATSGTGEGDASANASRIRALRLIWIFIGIMGVVSVGWLVSAPRERTEDPTTYHNDAIALNECAARLVLQGRDPYRDLDLFACYERLGIGADRTTPLRRGLFAGVTIYPTDPQLDDAWAERRQGGEDLEFVWRPSYPALSFLLPLPLVALGVDTNLLYIGCLMVAGALVAARSPASLRPFVVAGLLGATCLAAFTVGGSGDLLYALPLVAAWLWREQRWSAVAFGIAVATKQLAWSFALFYLIALSMAGGGRREVARQVGVACSIFLLTNLPFVLTDPQAWILGVLTPALAPLFSRGAGLILLSTNAGFPLLPQAAYLVLEAIAFACAIALAWRGRRTHPERGVVLAVVPLFFGWRSLFSYFFLLPLFAMAAVARMPLGESDARRAAASGALTLFAARAGRRFA